MTRDSVEMTDQESVVVEELRLVLPAAAEFVSLARFAAGLLAARSQFDLEEVQDLQLAVDELYALCGTFTDESKASYELKRRGTEVTVTLGKLSDGSGRTDQGADPLQQELSEQLLSALVDNHGQASDDEGRALLWLHKSHSDR